MNPAPDHAAAPGFAPDAVGLPWWRRAVAQGVGYLLPNSMFLLLPLWFAWPRLDAVGVVVLILILVVTGVVMTGSAIAVEWPESWRWVWIGLLIALIGGIAAVTGDLGTFGYFNAYVTAVTAILVPWRQARILMICTTILGIGIAVHLGEIIPGVLAVMGLTVGFIIGLDLRSAAMKRQLDEAEERTAVMAVAAERERIGRDLHDILGHSLTTIAVKADLAGRLAERDADAARAEIQAVADVARQALADVRATASGMREVRLATEVAAARSILKSAGIKVETPSAMPTLPAAESELLGYVVREAVTNVLRHSGARTCRIELGDGFAQVSDDGAGFAPSTKRSGLRGLERRLSAAGWSLAVDSGGGVTVRAERKEP